MKNELENIFGELEDDIFDDDNDNENISFSNGFLEVFKEDEDEDDLLRPKNRICKPKRYFPYSDVRIQFNNAIKMAEQIDLRKNSRYDALVTGNFILGDFVEALLTFHNIQAKKMLIATLSVSQENIDSLNTLMEKDYITDLSLILSIYFYGHEVRNTIPYIYKMLDIEDRFQLSIAQIHTKVCIFETAGGKKIVMHGSPNFRSSNNVEQFTIEINPELYDFYFDFFSGIEKRYKTINKPVLNSYLNKNLGFSDF